MRLADFQALIDRLKAEVPPEYLDGIVDIAVSPKTLPDPVRADVFVMGECIALEWSDKDARVESQIVLYHGSFEAMARGQEGTFDWRGEAWETLTHELRHHVESRANRAELEAYDWAADQNFARQEGAAFDPVFYRDGERLAPGIYKVDDDVFIELKPPSRGHPLELFWHGRRYRAPLPAGTRPPAFLTVDGLADPPPGDAVIVLPRRFSVFSLFRPVPAVHSAELRMRDADA
jgi:hypothetical protein